MTTVYLNGEGQRVTVVEERQGDEAANPWESMTPEADPPGRANFAVPLASFGHSLWRWVFG